MGGPPVNRADHVPRSGIVRFLIDECLSVDLVAVAGRAGREAYHVAHIGEAGWKD